MSSAENQDALIEKQMILNLQLEKMTQLAFGNKRIEPKKMLTTSTEEAIKEYNKQFKVVQYETELNEDGNKIMKLDEDGNPIPLNKRYQSIPPPELESINNDELAPFDEEEQQTRLQDFRILNNDLTHITRTFKIIYEKKRELTEKLNNLSVPKFDSSLSRKQNIEIQDQYDNKKNIIIQELKDLDDAILEGTKIELGVKDAITLRQNQEQLESLMKYQLKYMTF